MTLLKVAALLGVLFFLSACGAEPAMIRGTATASGSVTLSGVAATPSPLAPSVPTPNPTPMPTVPPTVTPSPTPTSLPAAPAIGAGPSRFTGTFMDDARPDAMLFLSLTQTGTTVSGYMLETQPDGHGGTKGTTVQLQGTTDGDALTLIGASFLNLSNVTITGRKRGEDIALTFPTTSGMIATLVFNSASQNAYNQIVAEWQASLVADYSARLQAEATATALAVAEDQRRQQVDTLSKKLAVQLDELERRTSDVKSNVSSAEDATRKERSAVQQMQDHLAHEKNDAAVRPLTCYQATVTVAYDYGVTLAYDYGVTLSYQRARFSDAERTLQSYIGSAPQDVADAQAIAQDLTSAMQVTSYRPEHATSSAYPSDAQHPIMAYQASVQAAQKELPSLQAADAQALAAANALMAQGKAVMDSAEALVTC